MLQSAPTIRSGDRLSRPTAVLSLTDLRARDLEAADESQPLDTGPGLERVLALAAALGIVITEA